MGDLHELVGGFEGSQTVAAYERGRPDYAPGTVPLVVERLRLAPGARVLDLAAGTGRLARPLLAAGMDVVAVEPLADMRAFLAGAIGAERVLDGRAEAIPLPDRSLAAVVVGNAWHWFDGPRAVVELARVLAPGGGVAIVVNEPVPAAAPEPRGSRSSRPGYSRCAATRTQASPARPGARRSTTPPPSRRSSPTTSSPTWRWTSRACSRTCARSASSGPSRRRSGRPG